VDGDYAYNSGNDKERRKATIEHVYRASDGVAKTSSSSAPWSFGWQMNERNLVWNNDLKLRLLKVRLIYGVPISCSNTVPRMQITTPNHVWLCRRASQRKQVCRLRK
jgi:hypothetical protein